MPSHEAGIQPSSQNSLRRWRLVAGLAWAGPGTLGTISETSSPAAPSVVNPGGLLWKEASGSLL